MPKNLEWRITKRITDNLSSLEIGKFIKRHFSENLILMDFDTEMSRTYETKKLYMHIKSKKKIFDPL